ncbi:MAG TPA: acetate--CoA ligase family protein [Candidatus Binatia bacterium]|jgi:acetyltransferase
MNRKPVIERMFYPRSVAVVGASGDADKFTGRVLKHLLKSRFKGLIFPVNPNRKEVQGVRAYSNLREIQEPIDVAVMMVPNSRLFDALEDCRAKDVAAALVLNSGFAEAGDDGKRLQEKLGAFARESGIRICGPNCNGYVNVLDKLIIGTSGAFDRAEFVPGDIAFLVQSGGVAGVLLDLAQDKKIGLSYCVSVGNEADLDIADFVEHLAEDARTNVIALFVEGVDDGRRFLAAVEKAKARGKQVVTCKVGRSAKGHQAASAHTGKLAGSSLVWSQAMKRAGVAEVADIEELVETANLMSKFRTSSGNRLAILTLSGGQGVLLADLCDAHGIALPPPSSSAGALREALPEFAGLANPIDLTGQASGEPEVLERVIRSLADDSDYDAVLLVLVASPVAARLWTERIARFAPELPKPVAVLWTGGRGLDEWRNQLLDARVPMFSSATVAIRSFAGYFASTATAQHVTANVDAMRAKKAREFLRGRIAEGIAEPEAKEIAKMYDIPVPREFLVTNEKEAADAARSLNNAVAMKLISPDILHRSDRGFVRLGIATPEAAADCYRDLVSRAGGARVRGVLVQPMVRGVVETIAGISYDAQFGPVVLFGSGGVIAELANDVAMRLCPVSADDCRAMIAETKAGKLLAGYRGAAAGDIEAVVRVLLSLSDLAVELGPAVKEMDINPLIAAEKGAVAVDVRLVAAERFSKEQDSWH